MVRLTSAVLLISAACALAAPVKKTTTLSLKKVQPNADITKIHDADVARWANLATGSVSIAATNEVTSYFITIGLGTPAQDVSVIFDTGSSDLWVQNTAYSPSSSSTVNNLDETFSIEYGSGTASGNEYTDILTIGGLSFTQEFGVSDTNSGFTDVDGLVGFGPDDLSPVTTNDENIPTPIDNAYAAGLVPEAVVGVYFQPLTGSEESEANGEITLGGVDTSKYTGTLTYVPITTVSESSYYWGVSISTFAYGSKTVGSNLAGIVDTGTTLILLGTTQNTAFWKNISGAKYDSRTTGLYYISGTSTSSLSTVSWTIGGVAFTLTPSQYALPAGQAALFGGSSKDTYFWIGSLGENITGLEFILGQKFLEWHYSVFDTTNSRIGLAVAA